MNIFKSLSQGNGTISETNITSFLSYLLNSANELNNSFLLLFFDLIDNNSNGLKVLDFLNLKQQTIRDRLIDFGKKYSVIADPEFALVGKKGKQIVDVFLKVINQEQQDILYFLIENKIQKGAYNAEQLSKQYTNLKESEDFDPKVPVISILITTDYDKFAEMHSNIESLNKNSVWLKWSNSQSTNNSLEGILRKLIKHEHDSEIQPINPNTQFIIKSFVDYILTEYSYRDIAGRNFSYNGFDVTTSTTVTVENKTYILKRFENDMIRAFDTDDNVLDIEVKPLLRKIIQSYKLDVALLFPGGQNKNTRHLGRDVINALNQS